MRNNKSKYDDLSDQFVVDYIEEGQWELAYDMFEGLHGKRKLKAIKNVLDKLYYCEIETLKKYLYET